MTERSAALQQLSKAEGKRHSLARTTQKTLNTTLGGGLLTWFLKMQKSAIALKPKNDDVGGPTGSLRH